MKTPRTLLSLRRLTFALAFTVVVSCYGEPGTCPWELPAGVKTVSVNGYPMAYAERGGGSPVVFVHGALNDYRFWETQLASLSAGRRVIAVSLRHHFPERWDGKGADYSLRQHTDDLAAFIEQLGGGPVDVVGHSRGGAIAAAVAGARPGLVRRLVLVEPALLSLLPAPGPEDPRVAGVKVLAGHFEEGNVDAALEFFVDSVNKPGTWKVRPEDVRRFARDNAWTISRQAADGASIGAEGLASLKMPVLLIGGENGPRIFAAMLGAAQKALPSAQRVTIPGAGHHVSRESAEAFARAVETFLAP